MADPFLKSIPQSIGFDLLDHGISELFVNRLMDIDAFQRNADLASTDVSQESCIRFSAAKGFFIPGPS